MAKIVRFNGNLVPFASSSLGTERTIFGQVTQANDITSQFTPQFLRGWGIVGPSDQPTLQDFNAVSYTHGQILAYLHQMGIAEYNAAQEYHIGSLCNVGGIIYSSRVDSNVGNAPASSPSSWALSGAGRLLAVQRFVASGTYTPTAGAKSCHVKVLGGAGAGGGAQGTAAGQQSVGGGGGAGGYSEGIISNPVATAITIGIGGVPGAAGLSPGGNGGASSYGATIVASGGIGGSAGSNVATGSLPVIVSGGVAGTGSGGSLINTRGVAGGIGLNVAVTNVASGNGGASVLGGGGQAVGGTGFGSASGTLGAGGSGGVCFAGVAGGAAGGAGGAGYVEIWEYS